MTDAELDALEQAAKEASEIVGWNMPAWEEYIKSIDPSAILELIAELRQAKELCEEHELYIAELERNADMYDHAIEVMAGLLGIDHDKGWMPEIDIILGDIRDLFAELRQAQAERDWVIEQIENGWPCPSTSDENEDDCDKKESCKDCWLKAAKEAVCQK